MPDLEKKKTGSSINNRLGCLIVLLIFGGCSAFTAINSQIAEIQAKRAKRAGIERIQTMPISEITLEEINQVYSNGSNHTALQKKEFWKYCKSKKVKWTGIVRSIEEDSDGLFMEVYIRRKMNSEIVVYVTLQEQEKSDALKLFEGSPVTFTGIPVGKQPQGNIKLFNLHYGTIE